MNRTTFRVGDASRDPHALVMAEPNPARRRFRMPALVGMALLAGVAGATVWMARPELGTLEWLPSTPTVEEQTAQAATPTPSPAVATVAAPGATLLPAVPILPPTPDLRTLDIERITAPPTPTPTRTPLPPLESVEAVAGLGGAVLWDESGLPVAQVAQGTLLSVEARSVDGDWLYATADGVTGWVAADAVIVFDVSRLRTEEVAIVPITPTSAPATPARAAEGLPSPTPAAPTTPAAVPLGTGATPQAGTPVARVAVSDTRLNIRSGPGSTYPIIAKALPGERLALRGRNAAGTWIQIDVPAVTGGFGWVAAEFVEAAVPLSDLPVRTEVNAAEPPAAPPTAGELGTTKGGMPAPGTGVALQITQHPATLRTAPRLQTGATGLQGKLVIQEEWGGDIYLYDLVTGALRLLTGGFDPSLSPDGRTVAFTRTGGEDGLYLIDVDGSNERLIFGGRTRLRSPKFSPDGRYIVFERGDQVIECRETNGACLPNTPANDRYPLGTEVQEKLARVDVNGQNYRDLPVLDRARAPDWGADGIVYHSPAGIQITRDEPDAQSELVFFQIRKQYELDPDWQPSGGRIAFQRREASHWEIFAVNLDGSNLQALTRPTFTLVDELPSNVAPAWSYDGRHLVFLSNRTADQSAGPWGVWVMDADGSNPRRLPIDLDFVYTFVAEQMLDWGP